jgi:hypothetical protein
VDPDGRITGMLWTLPDLNVQSTGSSYYKSIFPTPQVVRDQLLLTDDSGATTTRKRTVDLTTLH